VVTDHTGISGEFDIKLTWTPGEVVDPSDASAIPAGPSLFTAIQEQLGLKLESTRGPVEIFVVDSAEKPSEN
jgi:uncharacterized protein (TIGR03435 family)